MDAQTYSMIDILGALGPGSTNPAYTPKAKLYKEILTTTAALSFQNFLREKGLSERTTEEAELKKARVVWENQARERLRHILPSSAIIALGRLKTFNSKGGIATRAGRFQRRLTELAQAEKEIRESQLTIFTRED